MFNQLNPAELERLAIMSEELSELATVGHFLESEKPHKIGMDTEHPNLSTLELLELELADCLVAIDYLTLNKDLTETWLTQNSTRRAQALQEDPRFTTTYIGSYLLNISHKGIKLINKTIRHGYESYNPFDPAFTTNRQLLTNVLIDLNTLKTALVLTNTINNERMYDLKYKKIEKLKRYLHEQTVFVENESTSQTPTI